MAFVPEDGTGLLEANSLVSVEYANEYFSDRGNETWAALAESKKMSSLVLGTAYAESQYVYRGQRLNPEQGTAFPRTGVTDPLGRSAVGVPECIKRVVCELAVRASAGPLISDLAADDAGRPIKMKHLRAGPLQKTVEYAGPGDIIQMARYPAIDALMCSWLIYPKTIYANGVKVVAAEVAGTNNGKMASIQDETQRYSGPINENQKETSNVDGTLPI